MGWVVPLKPTPVVPPTPLTEDQATGVLWCAVVWLGGHGEIGEWGPLV